MKKVIISAALTGTGTSKEAAPTVPITAQEIAGQVERLPRREQPRSIFMSGMKKAGPP